MLPRSLLLALLLGAGCAAAPPAPPSGADAAPFAVLLGTAQDGGLPQLGCDGPQCAGARRDPARRRRVASLLLVDPRSGRRWLFDATPDLVEQTALADALAPRPAGPGRPPLYDGVFLTHAHVGHYLGLALLGREAHGSAGQLVHATPRMAAFLRGNGPWSLLVEAGHVALRELEPGVALALAPDLSVEAFRVPHRDEYSDTVGYRVRGPRRTLVFLPDIDKWSHPAAPRLADLLAEADVALLDGTFYGAGELPGRSMEDIPHPFIVETLARLDAQGERPGGELWFVHLNHSNPCADPGSEAARDVRARGAGVASEGQRFRL